MSICLHFKESIALMQPCTLTIYSNPTKSSLSELAADSLIGQESSQIQIKSVPSATYETTKLASLYKNASLLAH